MIIEQTVEIHDDRRLVMELPKETPVGRAKAAVTLFFETGRADENQDALSYRAGGTARSFRGILKGRGITLERFREIQRENKALEDAADERLHGEIR
jgi:hypothetical protein